MIMLENFYQRSNCVISDFGACDSITLDDLHKAFCLHLYGFELWNLTNDFDYIQFQFFFNGKISSLCQNNSISNFFFKTQF